MWIGLLVPSLASAGAERRTPIVEAVARSRGAIVNLSTLRVVPARFDNLDSGGRVRGLGTGILIDPRGYLVTNYHVVEEVDQITAITASQQRIPARVLNYDSKADIAVLKIDAKQSLEYLPLWGAGEAILGETVIAIGNPYGLENSIATGIVSAIDRTLTLPNGEIFHGLLQTDASINPGNSGGPLLNIEGDLLGINVAIRTNAQGIGFAIPTDRIRQIVQTVMGEPEISISAYGATIFESSLPILPASLAPARSAVRIGQVKPGSPAEKLGFRSGDELVRAGGQEVRLPFDLERIFWDRRLGDSIPFSVRRDGQKTLDLVLTMTEPAELTDTQVLWQYLGIRVVPIPADRVKGVYAPLRGGLLLRDVAANSAAARAGFQAGDILVGLHEWESIDPNNVRFVMQWKELDQHQPVRYHLIRDGAMKSGQIHMPRYTPPAAGS